MEPFVWDTPYETGIKEVDEQHLSLIELINRFGTELTENDMHSEHVESILARLTSYAQQHFEDEEQLMARLQVDSRHVEHHVREHEGFLKDVLAMVDRAKELGDGGEQQLLKFLTHWLAYHILGSDQNMARQMQQINDGVRPAKAYEVEEKRSAESTGPLLTALSGLFQQVSARNRELIQLNRTLEERVQERTRALIKANEDLEVLALTDPLTDLPNRRHAMRQLQELWNESSANGQSLSCMMIDADKFKHINDTYGHDAGDAVLVRLARELRHSVRSDDLVCRLGGDEFLIICPATPLTGAMHVAEQVRCNVAELKVNAGEGVWHGSISVGVAESSKEMTGIDDLLKTADDGVYSAKRAGRNCVRTRQIPVG